MAELLKGAPVAAAINGAVSRETEALLRINIIPALASIRIGERQDDIAYERSLIKRCEKAGLDLRRTILPADTTEEQLVAEIQKLNDSTSVHGVLLFRPLPEGMDDNRVRNMLLPEKDVDGITDSSLAGVFTGSHSGYAPCTARACMEILDYYGIQVRGKRAVVVGRSLVIGKPVAMMLLAANATVTVCHTRTVDMHAICREAEILVVSAGRAKVIDKRCLSPGQVVIDVGINAGENGGICGDVNFGEAEGIVAAITPVPGGTGAVTTSVLIRHLVQAAGKAVKKSAG